MGMLLGACLLLAAMDLRALPRRSPDVHSLANISTPISCQPDTTPDVGPFCLHLRVAEEAKQIVRDIEFFWGANVTLNNTKWVHTPYSVSSTDVWLSVQWNGDGVGHKDFEAGFFFKLQGKASNLASLIANYLHITFSLDDKNYYAGGGLYNMTGGSEQGVLLLKLGWEKMDERFHGVIHLVLIPKTKREVI